MLNKIHLKTLFLINLFKDIKKSHRLFKKNNIEN